jgi:hypothetical protein
VNVFATPIVDWATLGKVIAAALVASIGATAAFSFAVLGAARFAEMRRNGRSAEASAFALLGILGAAVCLAAIAGGIIAMTAK